MCLLNNHLCLLRSQPGSCCIGLSFCPTSICLSDEETIINLDIKTSFSLVEEYKVVYNSTGTFPLVFGFCELHFVGSNSVCTESINCLSCILPFFSLRLVPTNHQEVCLVIVDLMSGVKAERSRRVEMRYSHIELWHHSMIEHMIECHSLLY